MPLSKDMSFGEIVKKEIAAGKPEKQAVAIAYQVKSKGKKEDEMKDCLSYEMSKRTMSDKFKAGKKAYSSTYECPMMEEEESEVEGYE